METIFIKEDYVLLFYAIKKLLTAYHIDKSSTGKIIEPKKEVPELGTSFHLFHILFFNFCLIKTEAHLPQGIHETFLI